MLLCIKNSPQSWKLQPERVYTLGRNPDRDIRLDVPGISRIHAELFWDGTSWCLRDCDSAQGTYIGDRRVRESALEPEQEFRLGADPGIWLALKSESAAEAAFYQPPSPPTPPFSLADFRGQSHAKEELKRYADLVLDANLARPVQGILLQAGRGRGKRFLCRCLADELGRDRDKPFNFISRDLSDAYNLVQARKFIRKWLKECVKHAPSVLLLQNFETFYEYLEQAERSGSDAMGQARVGRTTWWQRLVSGMGFADLRSDAEKARKLREQLNDDIDTYWQWNLDAESPILILASVTHLESLPPEVRKPGAVFSFVQSLPKPDLEGRVATLEKFLSEAGTPLSREIKLPDLAQQLGRIDGRRIDRVVRDAERHRHEAGAPFLRWEDFKPFLPETTEQIWTPMFLPAATLQRLQEQAARLREWDAAGNTATPPENCLLYGPAGTGKTSVARCLAADANCELVTVTLGKVKSPFPGQSARNLQEIFAEARAQSPTILFCDDLEVLFPQQDDRASDPTATELIDCFLTESDRAAAMAGVLLLGATRTPERVDPSILDRLPQQIELPLPDPEARARLLRASLTETAGATAIAPNIDFGNYARLLAGKSGRDIEAIAKRIATSASGQAFLTDRDFAAVLAPQVSGELTGVILAGRERTALTNAISQFLKAIANPHLTPPPGLLLSGPPGTGKTEIARAMARLGSIGFQAIDPASIRDKYVGESNRKLGRIFEEARRNTPIILFFDEIDALFPARGEGSAQHEIELVDQFLQEVDGTKAGGRGIFILGATNQPERVDPAVRSRLGKIITIGLPELAERIELLQLFAGDRPVAPDLNWDTAARLLVGKSGRAIKARVEEAYHQASEVNAPLNLDHLQKAILGTGGGAPVPDLVLPPPIMARVESALDTLNNLPQAIALGLPLPKGMLLVGPPGTGKTQVARYLAARAGIDFRAIAPSDVKSSFYGGSVKKLREIFDAARDRAPCILFFDEIDALFPRREDDRSPDLEAVNEFLQQVDGAGQTAAGIFILGATNRPEALDEAVVSRLQQVLEIPLPGLRERRTLLAHALANKQWEVEPDVDLEAIARLLAGKSGRDVEGLLLRLGQAYSQRVGWEAKRVVLSRADFEQTLLPPVELDASAWDELVLAPELQERLTNALERFLRFYRNPLPGVTPPLGLLLYGPPGTGKTQIARILARASGCRFLDVPVTAARSPYMGEAVKKLAQTFTQARRETPAIIFIDEIEALFPEREEAPAPGTADLVNQLLQELDGVRSDTTGVFVVGATNFPERVDTAVRSRLNKEIEIPLPQQPEREKMLRQFLSPFPVAADFDWARIGKLLQGKTGRDIRQLVSEVGQIAGDRAQKDGAPFEIATEHFVSLLQPARAAGELSWDDIILPLAIKQELQRLIKLASNHANLPPGINPPKGALLSGPPGTGKTQIARVIASVANLYFKSYAPGEIRSKYVGQAAQNLADIFDRARRNSPAVLFFDEIESLFPERSDLEGSGADLENQNLVNQFLQEVDGVRAQGGYILVLGATNHPERIDRAARSRLQREIAIPLPETDERLAILQAKIHPDWQLDTDVDLKLYAESLIGYSGRDLTTGVETAAQLAFDEWEAGALIVRDRHFRQAFASGRAGVR